MQRLTVRARHWGPSDRSPQLDQLSLSGLPSLARVQASAEALRLLPALPGVSRLELAGDATGLTPAHMDAVARLPQLACMAVRRPWSGALAGQAAVLGQLRQRLPQLLITEDGPL